MTLEIIILSMVMHSSAPVLCMWIISVNEIKNIERTWEVHLKYVLIYVESILTQSAKNNVAQLCDFCAWKGQDWTSPTLKVRGCYVIIFFFIENMFKSTHQNVYLY